MLATLVPVWSGCVVVAPTAITPGRLRSRSSALCTKATFCRRSGNLKSGKGTVKVSTLRITKPRYSPCSRSKLRTMSPAPTSSISDSATSATTRPESSRRPAAPSERVRPPSASELLMLVRDMRSAGTTPKMKPTRSEAATAKPRVGRSSRGSMSNSPSA